MRMQPRKTIALLGAVIGCLSFTAGPALAASKTLTLTGTRVGLVAKGYAYAWRLHARGFPHIQGTQTCYVVQYGRGKRPYCSWQFLYQSGNAKTMWEVNTYNYWLPTNASLTFRQNATVRILNGMGRFANAKGTMRITYGAGKSARIALHVKS